MQVDVVVLGLSGRSSIARIHFSDNLVNVLYLEINGALACHVFIDVKENFLLLLHPLLLCSILLVIGLSEERHEELIATQNFLLDHNRH